MILLLETVALVILAVAALVALRVARHQVARLEAVDFVRIAFASRLAQGEAMDDLLAQVVASLRYAFALDAVELWLAVDGSLRLLAGAPSRPEPPAPRRLSSSPPSMTGGVPVSGAAWARDGLPSLLDGGSAAVRVAAIWQFDRLLGVIVVAREARGWRLAADVDATLEELAREVGYALNKARLDAVLQQTLVRLRHQADDLLASRARIVHAADSERRRIERDLHDGAQQYLVALGVKARLIHELIDRDPARTRRTSLELAGDAERAIEALRDLARGIYPMQLASSGLGPALAEACRRAGVATRLDVSIVARHPVEVEAAVYFCCAEALQNAAKHAGPDAVATVRVWEEPGCLRFEVADSGSGFDAGGRRRGDGLANMSDRMGAVGGQLEVESAPGQGTRVQGRVPLPLPVPVPGA